MQARRSCCSQCYSLVKEVSSYVISRYTFPVLTVAHVIRWEDLWRSLFTFKIQTDVLCDFTSCHGAYMILFSGQNLVLVEDSLPWSRIVTWKTKPTHLFELNKDWESHASYTRRFPANPGRCYGVGERAAVVCLLLWMHQPSDSRWLCVQAALRARLSTCTGSQLYTSVP